MKQIRHFSANATMKIFIPKGLQAISPFNLFEVGGVHREVSQILQNSDAVSS